MNEKDKQAEPVDDHSGLIKRIDAAIERVTKGYGLMTIPADPRSDVDLVLSECKALLQGENPPFWAKDFHPAPAVAQGEVAGYQFRTRPLHHREKGWSSWEPCDKQLFDACKKIPVNGDFEVESREVYSAAPAVAPAEVVRELVEALRKAEDAITFELGGEPCGLQTALIAVRAALKLAKEHGL